MAAIESKDSAHVSSKTGQDAGTGSGHRHIANIWRIIRRLDKVTLKDFDADNRIVRRIYPTIEKGLP